MSEAQYRHYLALLAESYRQDGMPETYETRYYYIEQEWLRKRWRVFIVDRRTGECRTRYSREYRDIRGYAPR